MANDNEARAGIGDLDRNADERERIRVLLNSPAYVRADRDPRFLERDDLRHARLELEYLKPELALREHGVESVIVLFGGTRIVEAQRADAKLQTLRNALVDRPDDPRLAEELAIAERVRAKSKYFDVAREFAHLVSERCMEMAPCELYIMTGGGPGIMEAGNRGAFEAGRESVGLNIVLPHEQEPNPYITPDLCFQFRYFALRKLHFMKRAKALVAFPGGYGTLDELFDALCLVQTRKMPPIPIVLVGESFWRNAFNAEFLYREGVISRDDLALFCYAETAPQIWERISDWHRMPPPIERLEADNPED